MTRTGYACLAILITGSWLAAPSANAAEVVLHVAPNGNDQASGGSDSPLATPAAALAKLRELAQQSPENINDIVNFRLSLEKGIYFLESPLAISRQHVPARGSLTIAAAPGKSAVLTGGKRITGWTVNGDGSWSVKLDEVARGEWTFRELFVGGQRRPQARHPNQDYVRVVKAFDDKRSGFVFQAGDLPTTWTDGGELVLLHDWSVTRVPVSAVDHQSHRLTAAFPIGHPADQFKIDHFEPNPRFFVTGHRVFLDAPGEWHLDRDGVLTYRPLPGEQPASVEAIAPLATSLVVVAGDDAGPVRRVHFEGVSFEHCAWQLPHGGYAEAQATWHEQRDEQPRDSGRHFVPAAIDFSRAEDCSLVRGRLAHVGMSGIQFGSRTARCRLEDFVIEDVSGNGVNLGEDSQRAVQGQPWWQAAPEQAAAGHVVRHCRIERCGQQFFGAVAVWVGLAREMQINNNQISHHPYTGVSVGWMWNPTPTPAGQNVVADNHIHHVMQTLSDGGGIYTLGRQPGTRLVNNLIHDVPLNAGRAESNGMFLDEGSDQMEIVGNTIFAIDRSPLRFHRAEQMKVRDNVLVLATPDTPPVRYNSTRPETIEQLNNRLIPRAEFNAADAPPPKVGPRVAVQ